MSPGLSRSRFDFAVPLVPVVGAVPTLPTALPEAPSTAGLRVLIAEDHPVSFRWITDEEMAENQHLIRTMSVKPPMGTGRVRLVMIGGRPMYGDAAVMDALPAAARARFSKVCNAGASSTRCPSRVPTRSPG